MNSETIDQLAVALAKAQGEIDSAKRDSENPFFKSKYADLASIWNACKGPLSKNGLCVIQTTERDESGFVLVTKLAHSSGQWVLGRYPVVTQKQDPQSLGSALTYARRYALAAIVGVVTEDDDGEGAMDRGAQDKKKTPPKQPAKIEPKSNPKPQTNAQITNPWGYRLPEKGWNEKSGKALRELDVNEVSQLIKWAKKFPEDKRSALTKDILLHCELALKTPQDQVIDSPLDFYVPDFNDDESFADQAGNPRGVA